MEIKTPQGERRSNIINILCAYIIQLFFKIAVGDRDISFYKPLIRMDRNGSGSHRNRYDSMFFFCGK